MALKSKENDLKRWVTPKKHINFKAAKQFARSRMVPLIMVVTRNCFEAITGKEKPSFSHTEVLLDLFSFYMQNRGVVLNDLNLWIAWLNAKP